MSGREQSSLKLETWNAMQQLRGSDAPDGVKGELAACPELSISSGAPIVLYLLYRGRPQESK